jgi:ABC-type nitrate/sulfonate/bicarbonate transport system ATPase subunit
MSGGQKKRVALYATITSDASVLLLDEALSEISAVESQNLP